MPVTHYSLVSGLLLHSFCGCMGKQYSLKYTRYAGVCSKNAGYAHQAAFQARLGFQGIRYRGEGAGTGAALATLLILCPGRLPSLPLILRDRSLSPPPPQGGRGNLSQKICHWLRGRGEGEGGKRVPTNSIKKRRKRGTKKKNA